jgi:GAF domain-containing protein
MVNDLPRNVPIHAQAIETRRPVIVADASDTELIPRAWIEAFHIKSSMVVPLIRQDEVIGVMTLDYTDRVTPFEQWQQDLGMAIGNQVALALENQRLYDLVQERLQEATVLLAVSQVGLSEQRRRRDPAPRGPRVGRTLRRHGRSIHLSATERRSAFGGLARAKPLLETSGAPVHARQLPYSGRWRAGRRRYEGCGDRASTGGPGTSAPPLGAPHSRPGGGEP